MRAGNEPGKPSGFSNRIWLSCIGVAPNRFVPKIIWCVPLPESDPVQFTIVSVAALVQIRFQLLRKRITQAASAGNTKVEFGQEAQTSKFRIPNSWLPGLGNSWPPPIVRV